MFSQHCAYSAKYPPSVFFPSHRFTKRLKFPSIFNRLREAIPGNDYDSYICITAYIRESRFLPHVSSFPHRLFKTQKNGSHFPTLGVGSLGALGNGRNSFDFRSWCVMMQFFPQTFASVPEHCQVDSPC